MAHVGPSSVQNASASAFLPPTLPMSKSAPLTCSGHTRPVVHLQFSAPDPHTGTYLLISSCKDGHPILRDWTGDWIGTFKGHKGAVWSAKLSSDGVRAVTASADFSAKVWDTFAGTELVSFPHQHIVRSVAISADASHILTAGNERKLRLFDLHAAPGTDPLYLVDPALESEKPGGLLAHQGTIKSVLWDEARAAAITAGEDKCIKWWDLRTLKKVAELHMPDPITSLEHLHDGDRLVVTSGKKVSFIDSSQYNAFKEFTVNTSPSSAALHPAETRFITGSTSDPWLRVHDFQTGAEIEILKGHHGPIHAVAYSPDGEQCASGSEDGTIRLWQTYPGTNYGLWATVDGAAA